MAGHTGFSRRAVEFYRELEEHNTKQFWADHKDVYEAEVREPMQFLLDELEAEFGSGRLFRPYRDVRFSKDKSPYKTHQGAVAGSAAGIGYYVQIDGTGLLVGGGFRAHASAQVDRFREAVDDDHVGADLVGIVQRLRDAGFTLEGEQLKTRPRGYAADHPRVDLLRHKSLIAVKRFGTPRWLGTARALDEVRGGWREVRPLSGWVETHVGPA